MDRVTQARPQDLVVLGPSPRRKPFLAGYLLVYVLTGAAILTYVGIVSPFAAVIAGLIYIISHVLRALRLAALSIDMLGTSGRTTVAMHFATAPFALLMPLKTGELVRFYALWKMSGNAVYSVIVLLIDRMYDSLFLFPILILLILQGDAPMLLAVMTMLVATIPLTVVVVGPKLLTELQRYVVSSQNSPVTLETLDKIDTARRIVTHAAEVARRQAPQLCVVSFMIWLCEFLVCLILINGVPDVLPRALDLLGARLVTFWVNADINTLVGATLTITLTAQLLPWPATVMIFFDRSKHEPQAPPALAQTQREVTT